MKNILLVLTLIFGTLISKGQSFTYSKVTTIMPFVGPQTIDVVGEIFMTDSTITETSMGLTSTTPIIKINEVEYKIIIGDNDIRYKFSPIPQFVKDGMRDKKGKWLVKEMEFATHVLITDMVDRFTNQHTVISIYLTPKQ